MNADTLPLPRALQIELKESQLESGALPSFMVEEGVATLDQNGFVTAHVLRALGRHTHEPELLPITERALDFLESCADPRRPLTFRFWPDGKRPPHLPVYPADADDTAVIATVLARHGRRDITSLRRTVLLGLFPHRVPDGTRLPATWVIPGTFWTWLDADFGYNLVDCTVNANVAALMATSGLMHISGYDQACRMIVSGVNAARGDERLTRLLSPYYPHPRELLAAVSHAVGAGAVALQPCLCTLQNSWGRAAPGEDDPVFCSAYGRVVWRSPLLQRLRRWSWQAG